MDLEKIGKTLDEIKAKPGRTVGFISLFALLSIGAIWANSFFGELGRKQAAELGEDQTGLQAQPQVRVTYYRFEGPLLLGKVMAGSAFSARDGFEFNPVWVENGVHSDLSDILEYLRNRSELQRPVHPGRLPYDEIDYSVSSTGSNTRLDWELPDEVDDPHPARDRLGAQFRGVPGALRGPNDTEELDLTDLITRVNSQPLWTIDVARINEFDRSKAIPWYGFSFFGPLKGEEALKYVQDPLSARLVRENPTIEDLVYLSAGAYHEFYAGTVLVRELKLVAVGIENIGDKPIGIDSLRGYESVVEAFDLNTEDLESLEGQSRNRYSRRSPIEVLRPGEHLMVPLAIELGIGTPTRQGRNYEAVLLESSFPQPWWRLFAEDAKVSFEILRGVDNDLNASVSYFDMPTGTLRGKPNLRDLATDVYYLGNTVNLTEIVFRTASGPENYKIRRFDPTVLAARGTFEVGSCPILYVDLPEGRVLRRPVLTNAVTRGRTATDVIEVPRDSKAFRLVEEEDEVSYVDAVYLEIVAEGRTIRYPPEGYPELASIDGSFREMIRGDSLDLRFPAFPSRVGNYRLVFNGFYVPNSLGTRSGSSR